MRFVSNDLGKFLGLALLAGFSLQSARAGAFTFSVADLTDIATVTDDQATGRLFGVNCNGEGCFFDVQGPTGTASFTVSYKGVPANGINLLEPLTTGQVSDWLNLTDTTSTSTFWQFASDGDPGAPLTPVRGVTIVEDGTVQPTLVVTYLDANATVIGTDTINLQSDVETPEPASILSMVVGLGVLGRVLYRQRAAAN